MAKVAAVSAPEGAAAAAAVEGVGVAAARPSLGSAVVIEDKKRGALCAWAWSGVGGRDVVWDSRSQRRQLSGPALSRGAGVKAQKESDCGGHT